MPCKAEATGCAASLRDVPGSADAAGFAAVLGDAVLGASCKHGCVEELDADGSLARPASPSMSKVQQA